MIAIRCDSSIAIGSGHVMRCLNLASKLREFGADVHFVCRKLPGDLGDVIQSRGFVMSYIDDDPNLAEEADAQQSCDVIRSLGASCRTVVIDHYGLRTKWHRKVRTSCRALIIAIDDLADSEFACDMIVNPNVAPAGVSLYQAISSPQTRLLLGPDFALLSDDYVKLRPNSPVHSERVERIVSFFGAADAANMTDTAVEAFLLLKDEVRNIDVVVGRSYAHTEKLLKMSNATNLKVHTNVERFSHFLVGADLMVGAGGTTQLERCCLGIPGLVIATAENQRAVADNMANTGASIYLGWHGDLCPATIASSIRELTVDLVRLHSIAERALRLVDGGGAARVAKAVLGS